MKLFGGGNSDDQKRQQLQNDDDVMRLSMGKLPAAAEARLKNTADRSDFFSSNLTANELMLAHSCGMDPVGQVMGTCVYHIGYQWVQWSGELDVYTDALMDAWSKAASRLQQEVVMLKAHGVIGVRLSIDESTWGPGMLDVQLFGTAVRRRGFGAASGRPFLSSLSGQEHWTLEQAGYQPAGIVFGACYFLQSGNWRLRMSSGYTAFTSTAGNPFFSPSGEMSDYSDAFSTVRSRATSRMNQSAFSLGATGVLDMKLDLQATPYEVNDQQQGLYLRAMALGTAVAPFGIMSGEPQMIVPMI